MTIQQLYEKLCTPEFQDAENGSLAYNFYIYQYSAEKEYEMRENIVDFCDKLARPAVFVDVLALNLFEEFCAFMEQTPLGSGTVLSESLESENEYPDIIAKVLGASACSAGFCQFLHKRIQEHLAGQQTGNAKPYIFVYGVGSMFPYLRAHIFLSSMEPSNQIDQYKMILFYPGENKGDSYSLFGRLNDTRPYRAILLNPSESNN